MIPRRNKISPAHFSQSDTMLFRTPYGTLKVKPNGEGIARVGIVIGASALRRAARRNFWKRHCYDTLFRIAPRGYDMLFIAGRGIHDLDPKAFEAKLAPIVSLKNFPIPNS